MFKSLAPNWNDWNLVSSECPRSKNQKWQRKTNFNTNSKKYPIYIGYNILKNSKRIFKKNNIQIKKCLIVVDKNVPKKNISVLKKNKSLHLLGSLVSNEWNNKNKVEFNLIDIMT